MPPPRRCRWRRCRGCVGNLPWHDDEEEEGIWWLAVWFWYSWKSNSVWVGIGIPGPGSLGLLVIRVWVWEPQEAQDVVADGGTTAIDGCHCWWHCQCHQGWLTTKYCQWMKRQMALTPMTNDQPGWLNWPFQKKLMQGASCHSKIAFKVGGEVFVYMTFHTWFLIE